MMMMLLFDFHPIKVLRRNVSFFAGLDYLNIAICQGI